MALVVASASAGTGDVAREAKAEARRAKLAHLREKMNKGRGRTSNPRRYKCRTIDLQVRKPC